MLSLLSQHSCNHLRIYDRRACCSDQKNPPVQNLGHTHVRPLPFYSTSSRDLRVVARFLDYSINIIYTRVTYEWFVASLNLVLPPASFQTGRALSQRTSRAFNSFPVRAKNASPVTLPPRTID